MSECLFDPTAEGCETVDSFAAAPGGEPAGMSWGPPESASDLNMTQNEILFGMATFIMMFNGVKLWQWYPKEVKNNNLFYPDRIAGTVTHDEEWALSTREITAWTNSSNLSLGLYGPAFLLWGMNILYDNEGGRLHTWSFKFN